MEYQIRLAPDTPKRCGIASALYREFAAILEKQGYRYIYGVIVDTNEASLEYHKSLGFREVGAGYKLGAWRGIRWLVKQIGANDGEPQTPLGLPEVIGES